MIVKAAICDICGQIAGSTPVLDENTEFALSNHFSIRKSKAVIADSVTGSVLDIRDECRAAIQGAIDLRPHAKRE